VRIANFSRSLGWWFFWGLIFWNGLGCTKTSSSSPSSGASAAAVTGTQIVSSINPSVASSPGSAGLPASGGETVGTSTNSAQMLQTGDPSVIQYSQHLSATKASNSRQLFLSAPVNALNGPIPGPALPGAVWQCPANSFMVGMSSTYDSDTSDRYYHVQCAFMEDGTGAPLVRDHCQITSFTLGDVDSDLTCPLGLFPAGLASRRISASPMDRSFQLTCCQASTQSGAVLAIAQVDGGQGIGPQPVCDAPAVPEAGALYGTVANRQINTTQANFSFTCTVLPASPYTGAPAQTNKVLTALHSEYSTRDQDRRWGFDCCELGLESSTNTQVSGDVGP